MQSSFKVVIPSRYASTRLPGKPLLEIAGKTMLQHVYERAMQSGAEEVVIATDDERIVQACDDFSARVCMTADSHQSGTDRIAEVIQRLSWHESTIVVNCQGDEPLINPAHIRLVAESLGNHADASIATLATPVLTGNDLHDPNTVKVVVDNQGYALYFSRAAIPWDRDAFAIQDQSMPVQTDYYRHIGLYAYQAGFITQYSKLSPCPMELAERLEQLRALWYGYRIHVSIIDEPPVAGVDTQEDLDRIRELFEAD